MRILEEMSIGPAESGWIAFLASLTPIGWLFLGLLLFLLLTRGPEDTNRDVALGRRWPMLGPALPALSVYALIATGVQKLAGGLPDHKPGEEPPWPGPYVPRVIRRTAAVPIAFIGDALFRVMIGETSLGPLASPMDSNTPLLPVLFGAVVSALPFTLFVAGPRIVAGAPLAWTPWIIRFAFFYLSAWFGHYIFAS